MSAKIVFHRTRSAIGNRISVVAWSRGKAEGDYWLIASVLRGSSLRLMEGLRFRVKDIDSANLQSVVGSGKDDKDRVTTLPEGWWDR